MNTEFAGCGEHQSGQRFLSGSVPRLRRHAAPYKTAGGESVTLPAGKDQKPLREFEGGALNRREAPVLSSLDEVQINRDRPKDGDAIVVPLRRVGFPRLRRGRPAIAELGASVGIAPAAGRAEQRNMRFGFGR